MLVAEPIVQPTRGVLYPVEPFARWLDRLVREAAAEYPWRIDPTKRKGPDGIGQVELSPAARVAARCGLHQTALDRYRWRKVKYVTERVVDAACTAEGSTHISEIYPAYLTRPVVKKAKPRRRR